MPELMQAQVLTEFGPATNFELRELPRPKPGQGEVVVRIVAASVNPADTKIRRNGPSHAPDLPAILGLDMAGTVEAVGTGVEGYKSGDAVFGCCGGVRGVAGGTMSTHVLADARLLAHAPRSISLREAAALPLVSITAWEAVVERGAVKPNESVLVFGGTGGVGHIALQLCRHLGARVATTVSSEEKAALARALGADEVINYRAERPEAYVSRLTGGAGFNKVIDAVSGRNLDAALDVAGLYATVVSISTRMQYDLTQMHAKSLTLHVIFMLIRMIHNVDRAAHGAILARIAELVDEGAVRPLLDSSRFTLAELPAAHQRLEGGLATGKIVVDMPD